MRYIMGPAPLDWLSKCSLLGGKCLNVGIALWWVHGMSKKPTVPLTRKVRKVFGVGRSSASYALGLMEKAGLVEVERHQGRAPRITMLWDGTNEQEESDEIWEVY
jgi:hypothetical protein